MTQYLPFWCTRKKVKSFIYFILLRNCFLLRCQSCSYFFGILQHFFLTIVGIYVYKKKILNVKMKKVKSKSLIILFCFFSFEQYGIRESFLVLTKSSFQWYFVHSRIELYFIFTCYVCIYVLPLLKHSKRVQQLSCNLFWYWSTCSCVCNDNGVKDRNKKKKEKLKMK